MLGVPFVVHILSIFSFCCLQKTSRQTIAPSPPLIILEGKGSCTQATKNIHCGQTPKAFLLLFSQIYLYLIETWVRVYKK